MSMPLAHYLKDFSAPASAPAGVIGSDFSMPAESSFDLDFPAIPEAEPVDLEAERRAAYAEGHEAATAELSQKHASELAALEAAHAEAMAALEARVMGEAASRLAAGLERAVAEMAFAVSEHAATAIAPFLSQAVAEKAVADLADLLTAAVADGQGATITLKGPRVLFDLLVARMPEMAEGLRHVEDEDLDLSADVEGTVLVTRISAFAASLKKVLG
ncbi:MULTISPECIES: GTPase [Alphaproteobacteria]|uniref:Uncharacterized protein n=2 Tax=Alphaproteobacteria TaxID=28211 RepID=A0A512HIG5_9HYPH|nr:MULTISPECIES: GTPase [Alphaproteobacteria]GEO85247.1 hypothetical protein RNA01_21790 [Ciceribacter naphthalenivorans]GLR24419.1 hypothetical protein GCM10007920_42130 [Ciceribacter naphthalenivorans]GLT07275.1 hypothetical protein GCM10007926_42130 [Sphingomonas psychrolutea]